MGADQLRFERALFVKQARLTGDQFHVHGSHDNLDPLRTSYDVCIGDDVAGWIDDHSRPNPTLPLNDVFTAASLAGRPESANRNLDDGGQNPLGKIVHRTVQVRQCAETCSPIVCGRLAAASTLTRRSLTKDTGDHGQEYERN
jgi:hypothetical protein